MAKKGLSSPMRGGVKPPSPHGGISGTYNRGIYPHVGHKADYATVDVQFGVNVRRGKKPNLGSPMGGTIVPDKTRKK